jgi:hypothetical protein
MKNHQINNATNANHPVLRQEKQTGEIYAKDMNPQDDPDKASRRLQAAQRERLYEEMLEAMEFFYDWLDSGKSFEELANEVDIGVAAGALPGSGHEFCRLGLEVIRTLREEGADRNEVMTYLRERGKDLYEITERDGWR